MAAQHIVVDGSNIATEGRSTPSLKQLEEAVAELRREHPGAEVTVIVDATFAHRIDPSELDHFEKAALAGDYVHPPAGAIGRGDAFLLRVAEKVDGTVLSNDSFQEFHGEHPWLFERGRLLGVTPVPGIGWIFSPRTPVRGPTSRQAVREAEKAKREVSKAIRVATKEAVAPPQASGPRPKIGDRRVMRPVAVPSGPKPVVPAAVNDPLTFVSFIANHPLGAEVTGGVESYTSHGAVVMVGNVQCYVPLANLASPPPRSAREVLKRGEDVTFVVRALDPQRRGVELALPGVGTVSGHPSEEMIEAEVEIARRRQPAAAAAAPRRRTAKAAPEPALEAAATAQSVAEGRRSRSRAKAAAVPVEPVRAAPPSSASAPAPSEAPAPARRASGRRTPSAPISSAPTTSAPAGETAPTEGAAPSTRRGRGGRAARTGTSEATAAKAPAPRVGAAKAPAAKTAGKPAARVGAEREPVGTRPAATASPRKAPAIKQPASKAPARKAPATKAPATKAPATRAPAAETSAARTPVAKAAAKAAKSAPAASRRPVKAARKAPGESTGAAKKSSAPATPSEPVQAGPRRSPRATRAANRPPSRS
jgi:hypothetical protein